MICRFISTVVRMENLLDRLKFSLEKQ